MPCWRLPLLSRILQTAKSWLMMISGQSLTKPLKHKLTCGLVHELSPESHFLVAQNHPAFSPAQIPAQAGKALALLLQEQQLKARQATSVSKAGGSTVSLVAAEIEKVPPQQGVQGQRPIKFQLQVLHHFLPWDF